MEAKKTRDEQIKVAQQLEMEARLSEAATIYQKLFNSNPVDEEVMGRLLVIYRKLKDYKKELSVLNDAIAAYHLHQKAVREKWIQSHPKAASAGRSMLRQLEKGNSAFTGVNSDPAVTRWVKRKNLVTRRITGKKVKRPTSPEKVKNITAKRRGTSPAPDRQLEPKANQRQRIKAAAAIKKAAKERRDTRAAQKMEDRRRKAADVLKRKQEQEQRKVEARLEKAEANRKKAESRRHLSLFIITLRYLTPIAEIETAMPQHTAYLDKHYHNGNFLVSGSQVPGTGGIIIVRGTDRNEVEKILKQDPFVKHKLASVDIIEFKPNHFAKELQKWLKKK